MCGVALVAAAAVERRMPRLLAELEATEDFLAAAAVVAVLPKPATQERGALVVPESASSSLTVRGK